MFTCSSSYDASFCFCACCHISSRLLRASCSRQGARSRASSPFWCVASGSAVQIYREPSCFDHQQENLSIQAECHIASRAYEAAQKCIAVWHTFGLVYRRLWVSRGFSPPERLNGRRSYPGTPLATLAVMGPALAGPTVHVWSVCKAPMQSQMPGVRVGRVIFFAPHKGFGFIEDVCTKAQVFVHYSSLVRTDKGRRSLWVGEYVNFVLLPDRVGRIAARSVTGISGGPLMCETRSQLPA